MQYGKSEHGFEFPLYQGELLSWSIGLYSTLAEQEIGYPRMRTVIRAMHERRPEQLERERIDLLKGTFDKVFGRNAKRELAVLEDELAK